MTTVGGDPEFFIVNAKGKPVPAHKVGIPGKDQKVSGDHYKYFRDGYVVELNLSPATCRAFLNEYTKQALRAVKRTLPAGYSIVAASAMPITKVSLKGAPKDVLEFGCDPSMDAYTEDTKYSMADAATTFTRFAGGHLHWGGPKTYEYEEATWPNGYYGTKKMVKRTTKGHPVLSQPELHPQLGRLMDLFIGVPLSVIFNGPEQQIRREFYGQAGEYRTQDYDERTCGFEYRVPPSEMWQHQALVTLFAGVGRVLIDAFKSFKKYDDKAKWDSIREAINLGKGGEQLLTQFVGFYTPETILKLRDVADIRKFYMAQERTTEAHTGWTEFASQWGLPGVNAYQQYSD